MSNETTELQVREKQPLPEERTRPGPMFRPDVDILEQGDAYLLYADLPGVDDRHVDVRLDKGVLSLDAQLAIQPDDGWQPVHTEYRLGAYHREFRISEDIDPAGVTASMRDGVLELRLPKSETHKPRTIAVQAA